MIRLGFEILKVGHCVQNEHVACRAARWRKSEFPALVALLRHPSRGHILFDTGYAPRFFDVTASWPERLYRLATPVTLPDDEQLGTQLAARRLSVNAISTVIVSHFHADHICGLADFGRADFVCARSGLQNIRAAKGLEAVRQGLLPGLVPSDLEARVHYIEEAADTSLPASLAPFCEGRDILGDGSLIAIPLPGHAVGQFGLLFTAEDGSTVLLAADGAFSMFAIRKNALPLTLAALMIGHNPQYAQTLDQLHRLDRQNSDIIIIPAHCRERQQEFVR